MSNNDYGTIHSEIVSLLKTARASAARSVNALMTATYSGRSVGESSNQNKGANHAPTMAND